MAFICSKITRYEVLFIVALGLFTHVSCQFSIPKFIVREIGSSINFTCPDDLTKNHTYKFSALKKQTTPELITPGARIKLFGPILMIVDLEWDDNGQYFCSIYDSNGNQIGKTKSVAILNLKTVPNYPFKILPTTQSSVVDEGISFEFRCEYGKGLTQMKWLRLRFTNGTRNEDYIPRNLLTVRTDSSKSVEVYSIKKVTLEDSGTYRCEITEKSGKRETQARVLQVKREKVPVLGDMKPIFVVNKGDDVRIALDVTGTPSPNISCYHKDRLRIFCSGKTIESVDISQNSPKPACSKDNYDLTGFHELIIRFATFAGNDGMYICEASNSVGNDTINFRVNVTVPPMISRENSKYFAQRKSHYGKIKCIINLSNPRPTVIWSQQDLPTSSSEADPDKDKWTVSSYKSKLDPTHRGGYDSILTIPWEKEESSFYRCFAGNKYGNDSRVFKFIRYGEGKEPIVVTPKSAVKNEGKTFIANCRVIVVFGGNIVFYRDNRTVMTNDDRTNITITQDKDFRNITMVIRNLTVNDSGTYLCSEKDVSTNNYTQFVTLTVKALRPPVILDLQNQTVDQDKDKDKETVLFCNVTGNPYPKVIWLRNSKPVEAKTIKSLNCVDQKSGYYYKDKEHTQLAICEPKISYKGFYTCVVENQIGSNRRDVYLNVVAKPMFTKPTSLENKELGAGASLNHPCIADGNPTPWVQWIMKNENKPMTNKSKKESILKINKMDESYVGNYSCRAWNSIGSIESHFLELKLKPPPEKIPGPLPSGDSMGAGSIVGIVIGITIFLIVVFIIIFLWYRRQQKKLLFYKHQYFLRTGEYSVDPSLTLNEQSMNLPYDSDWEFPFERLVLGERLGAGAFGEVYKAEAMGILALNPRDKSSIANKRRSKIRRSLRASQRPKKKTIPCDLSNAVVAVKSVKGQATENEIRDLAAELKLMIHIGEHKNIVNLLGACTTGRKLYVILEFCPYGNLLMFLRSKRDMYNSTWVKEIYDPDKEFTLIDIVGAAFQIAKGMDFLASRKLIHRDLAARNILVADEYVMKISDFGLARDIYQNDVYVKTSSGMLPVKWMAVESLFDRVYTHQSDVWSFGVLLWEMMTLGGTPYPDLPAEQLLDFLNEGKRMTQPNKCPLEVYTIMRDCWQEEPEARPTFATLVEHLGRILERHMEKANPYLHVEASPEEIEAAKEKDELVKPKSDYYLQPLLMSNKLHGYDSNAPLPTPPTDSYTQAIAPIPKVDTKPSAPTMKGAGSYELLREENPDEPKVLLDGESGIGLEDVNNRNHNDTNNVHGESKSMESVV